MIRKPPQRYLVKKGLSEPTELDPYEITFFLPDGRVDRKRSVADLAGLPNISRAFLGAYFRKYAKRRKDTQENVWLHMRRFIKFLLDTGISDSIIAVDELVLREYLYSLKNGTTSAKLIWQCFKSAEDLCLRARLSRGLSLMKFANPVPGVGRSGGHVPHFSPALLFAIIAAAKKEARATWLAWEAARLAPAESPVACLRTLLAKHYEDVIPINWFQQTREFEHFRALRLAVKACGSRSAVEPLLYPTPDSIIPFVILLAYETAANSDALYNFQRECISDDVLFADRSFIMWEKARAGSEQRVSRDNRGYFSAPQLVKRVLEYTQPLTKHADSLSKSRLFLVRHHRGKIVPLDSQMASRAIKAMAARHGICWTIDGNETMNIQMMRPTVIAEIYRQTSDLFVTMRFANHASPQTTIRYVIDQITDELHDVSIAMTQTQLSNRVRKVEKDIQQEATIISRPSLGMERDCANPYDAPAKLAPGSLCPEWLWPLTDPGLIVPDDPTVAVTHVRMARALNKLKLSTNASHFALVYGDALRIITQDVLPMLSPATIDAAELLANLMPAIKLCEDE